MQATTELNQEAFEQLAASFRGTLTRPGDPDYERARLVRNGLIDRFPALIARCRGTADVVNAVNFAREQGLDLSVRGGSHNVAGLATNDGGIVIDLSEMRAVLVDPAKQTAYAQGGATWGDVDRETQMFGLAAPGGVISTTGVGGLTLQGGLGWLRRKYGASVDSVKSVEIVTADGQVRTASETEHPDLFWAVRGAGNNFGVVTRFEFELHPVGPVVYAAAPFFAISDAPAVMDAFRTFVKSTPDDVTSMLLYYWVPPGPPFPEELWGQPAIIAPIIYSGDPEQGERVLAPVREFAPPIFDLSGPYPYAVLQSMLDEAFPKGWLYYWKSTYLNELSAELLETFMQIGSTRPTPMTGVAIWQMGGAFGRVPENAMAFANRSAPFLGTIEATWQDPADTERCIAWARDAWATLRRFGGGGLYPNFAGFGEEKNELARAAFGGNYERLVELKTKYDPDNLFHINLNIPPEPIAAAAD
jgi:FAD/FMN-containing dehydrogenase